jgi:Undecaprenyl-phosphate glucose phosphotransferase
MLEKSVNSSTCYELSQGSFYDLNLEMSEDLVQSPALQKRAFLQHFVGISIFCDFCFFVTTFALSPQSFGSFADNSAFETGIGGIGLAFCGLAVFYLNKLYRIETIAHFRFFCARFSLIFLGVIVAAEIEHFMVSSSASSADGLNLPIAVWAGLTLGLLLALRYALSRAFHLLATRGHVSHNVVVIGSSTLAETFITKLHADKLGVRVRAIFEKEAAPTHPAAVAGVAVRGNVAALLQYTKHHLIDTVVIASDAPNDAELKSMVAQISVQPLRIAILPPRLLAGQGRYGSGLNVPFAWCAQPGQLPGVNLMHLADIPIHGLGSVMKSAMDVIVALAALVLFAPLLLICAAGIKLSSPGPVFFMQKRIGYGNKEFLIFKFRTMHLADCNTGVLTQRNDPRIFKFGEILRKFSLDELPQLLNVLRGNMSLVGPRPHIQEARAAGILYFKAVPNYPARHRVKPGITGHAQISGYRGPTETIEQIENRVAHDLHYVENWSLLGDVKILFKTIFVGFFGENAF